MLFREEGWRNTQGLNEVSSGSSRRSSEWSSDRCGAAERRRGRWGGGWGEAGRARQGGEARARQADDAASSLRGEEEGMHGAE